MKNSTIKFVLVVIIGLLVWLLLNRQGRISSLNSSLKSLDLKSQEYKTVINNYGIEVIEQKQLILSQKNAINTGILELNYWKTVKSKIEYEYKTIIDSFYIPYIDSIHISDTIYPKGFIETPKRFKIDSTNLFKVNGIVLIDGVIIDSIIIENKIEIIVGTKKNGLFKKNEQIVSVKNSNPLIKSIGLNNVVIENKNPFYKKNSFIAGVTFFASYFVFSKINK